MNQHKKVVYYTDKKPDLGEDVMYIQHQNKWVHFSGGYGDIKNIKNLKPHSKKLRFYHTYWSKPALEANRWQFRNQHYLSIVFTAMSLWSLKALGQEVVLHTDIEGAKLLGHLPYDAIYTDLQDNPVSLNFWASGKFYSLIKGETGIHIDTDLFITSSEVIDILADNNFVITNFEKTEAYKDSINAYIEILDSFEINHPFKDDLSLSINCGLIKLPEEIKKKYVNFYFKFVTTFQNNIILNENSSIEKQSLYSPDLLIEQLLLKKLSDAYQLSPVSLINAISMKEEDYYKIENICHLLSFEKYVLIPLMLNYLKQYNNDLFKIVEDNIKHLGFDILLY
jgi:hypothetical protein